MSGADNEKCWACEGTGKALHADNGPQKCAQCKGLGSIERWRGGGGKNESIIRKVAYAISTKIVGESDATYLAAAEAAMKARREPLLAIIAAEEEGYLSPEYATGQPLSSLQERFACKEVAKAIAAALSEG